VTFTSLRLTPSSSFFFFFLSLPYAGTFMGLGSLGLVLSILLPDVGAKAYLMTLLSPYAGKPMSVI
jgi:hypothetical protein